jgi:hypothetical protein
MDILRNLFGNLTSGIIRLGVTVGILAAVYFFIVRPVLDTTNNAIDQSNRTFRQSFGKNGAGLEDLNKTMDEVNKTVEREIKKSFHFAEKQGANDPKKLIKCIQRAHADVNRIQRCTVKF